MTVRSILQLGDPALRVVAEPVDPAEIGSPEVQRLVDDLIETMRDANGAGLAATQIGVHRRVVVMEVADNPRYPYKPRLPLTVAINPVIEPIDDETVVINEGCLSVPVRGDVTRHVQVRVRYLDREGVDHDEVVRGLTAGTWQHECDHLDGLLIVDRADPRSLSTWEEFERHHRDAFVERISAFVERVGS
ncbi:MAG: peptide deformylase [Acidimicrobiales bacterium]|nr:peptide deformylase [Acidimicrobiales bacterium]